MMNAAIAVWWAHIQNAWASLEEAKPTTTFISTLDRHSSISVGHDAVKRGHETNATKYVVEYCGRKSMGSTNWAGSGEMARQRKAPLAGSVFMRYGSICDASVATFKSMKRVDYHAAADPAWASGRANGVAGLRHYPRDVFGASCFVALSAVSCTRFCRQFMLGGVGLAIQGVTMGSSVAGTAGKHAIS